MENFWVSETIYESHSGGKVGLYNLVLLIARNCVQGKDQLGGACRLFYIAQKPM